MAVFVETTIGSVGCRGIAGFLIPPCPKKVVESGVSLLGIIAAGASVT